MNNQNSQESFSWLRKTFFPVHIREIPKVLPFAIMFCGIIFSYTLARQAKDWLILGLGGSHLFSSAKIFVMIAGFIFGFLHKQITSNNSHYKAFLKSFLPFFIFFLIFPYLYKYLHVIQMSPETIQNLSAKIPLLRHFIAIIGNWAVSLYYIMSEMFGTFMLGATFWQLANFYSTHEEAKRFYPFYSLIAQFGGYLSGTAFKYIGSVVKVTNQAYGIFLITVILTISGIIIISAATYFFQVTLKMPEFQIDSSQNKNKKKKHKLGIVEMFKNLAKNPNFILVCLLTVWYGICATSMETFWKGKVKDLYGIGAEYMNFYGSYIQYTSITSLFINILGGSLIRLLPWLVPAIITPIVLLLAAFFLFGVNVEFISKVLQNLFNLEPLYLCVIIGAASLIFFKAAKYILFDPTKELFIRNQSEENAIEIKALETSVARLGKGGSAVIQSIILSIPGMTMDGMAPILWILTTIMGIIWVFSILRLNKDMVIVEKEANKKK